MSAVPGRDRSAQCMFKHRDFIIARPRACASFRNPNDYILFNEPGERLPENDPDVYLRWGPLEAIHYIRFGPNSNGKKAVRGDKRKTKASC